MAKATASVIVPAFNAEKTIGACIESLLAQGQKALEIIVVDDGSADRTLEIIMGFGGVKLVKQNHAGPAVARNRGAKAAKGEIIIFTDSDCIAEPDWLEEMLKPFSDPVVAGVQGRYKCRQREIVARLIQLEIGQRYEKMEGKNSIDFISTYSAAYRKSVFEEFKGFDTSFPMASGEDTDLSFRVHEAGCKMVFSPKAIVWHTHPTSWKKYFRVKFFRAFWRTKVYRKHKGKMLNDSYTSQTMKAQLILLLFACLTTLATIIFPVTFPADFFLPVTEGVLTVLFITTLPFSLWAARRDLAVGIIAPFAIILRTVVFSCGLVLGAVNQLAGVKK
jgi:cellulose synthase/poly-beta-1,6-N-acetylglucosamine synthase-like glycosyltransferase